MVRRGFTITDRARGDLRAIGRYIREESGARRAEDMLKRVLVACELFASQPAAGRGEPELGDDVRSFRVHPFLVAYRPRRQSIEILRVIHGARDREAAWNEPDHPADTIATQRDD